MRFGDYELDFARFELRRAGHRVRIQPKVLDLLVYLSSNRDRVVSKEELLEALWRGVIVSDSALTHAVKEARRVVRDDGERQAVIRTVRGRGYRFVARVHEPAEPSAAVDGNPFVGREAVMVALQQELELVERGRGRSVFLTGEPGIGKSRAAMEFTAAARECGTRALVGRCVEGPGAPAYWPWAQLLRGALRRDLIDRSTDLPGDRTSILAWALPGLALELGGDLPEPVALPDDEARFRLCDALSGVLSSLARRAPLVVLVEDLQWADPSSLKLFVSVAEQLSEDRVLLLGTYRETELAREPLRAALLGSVVRKPGAYNLHLEGLTRGDVGRFLEMSDRGPVSSKLVDSLHDRTGGNPFFLTQIVQLWETLPDDAEPGGIPLPQGVREAIGHHLDVLSESCRDMLSRASVIGREFGLDVLAHVSGVSIDDVLETLESALEAGVVRAVGESWTVCEFAHALIPETLYEAMSTARRLRLHGRVGRALEDLRGDEPGRAAEVAHHFALAMPLGHAEASLCWSLRAAEFATRQLAYEEAVVHYERALEALCRSGAGADRRLEIRLALAESQARAGQVTSSRRTFQEAADLAREQGSSEALARAALGLDWDIVRRGAVGTDALRVALLREALEAAGSRESPLRVRLLAALDEALYFDDAPRPGPSLSREAVEMARRLDDPDALAFALNRRHLVLRHPTGLDERLVVSKELAQLARQRRQPDLIFDAHGSQIHDALERGEIELVEQALGTFERLAGEYRIPKYLWYADLYRAMRELLAGRFVEAEPRIARAYAIGSRVQEGLARLWHVAQMQALRIDQARAEGFLPELREVAEAYPIEVMRLNVAWVEALTGCLGAGRHALEQVAVRGVSNLRRDITWLLGVSVLAQLCELCRHREAAAILYEELRPFERQHVVIGTAIVYRGSVATDLGRLATLLGRFGEAEHHFAMALLRERRMGARPFEAGVQLAWARMLLARGDSEGREEARRRLESATVLAAEVGAYQTQHAATRLQALAEA